MITGTKPEQSSASPPRKKSPYKDILCGIAQNKDEAMGEESYQLEADSMSDEEFIATSDSEDEGEDDLKCPRIRFSAAEKASFWKPWSFSIICRVLGKRVGFNFLASKLYKFWQKDGIIEIIDLANDFYLVQFSNKGDYLAALRIGPWMVADHLISITKCNLTSTHLM